MYRSRKYHGAIPISCYHAPLTRHSSAEPLTDFVHLDFQTDVLTHHKSDASNLTLHLTQMQWHHGEMDSDGTYMHTDK